MYSEKSSMRASHRPAAFCAFRLLLLVPFVALCFSIGNSPLFVKEFPLSYAIFFAAECIIHFPVSRFIMIQVAKA